ncbi:MAG: alpha/beta fold hydrolase [Lentisphaeria bacterium]|nr:alpha/beta fold hydrolase [Lentisphaeria bacterium]
MKIRLILLAGALAILLQGGCASSGNAVLNKKNLFGGKPAVKAESAADYDSLVFKSEGSEIYGQILIPDRSFGENRPCVLFFHGFAGFGRFDDVAQALCRAGCVAVVVHHRGAWGSQGKYSVSNCVRDAVNLVRHVKSPDFQHKYHTASDAVFLVGHSMGGNTVLNAAVQVPGVKGIVMLAPCDIGTMSLQMTRQQMHRFMLENGLEVLRTDGFEAVYRDITDHAAEYAFPAAAKRLKNTALLMIGGQWDTCISNEALNRFYAEVCRNRSVRNKAFFLYPAKHGLMGVRPQICSDIADFILDVMSENKAGAGDHKHRRISKMNEETKPSLLVNAIPMPQWLVEREKACQDRPLPGDEAKIRLVVELAVENVRRGTGGPFAAAIFDIETDRLVAFGVNVVVPSNQSWAHAEMTAFARAQNLRNSHSLKGCMLVTSCEPCAMCSGATPWSGVEKMVYGAPRTMAEKVGFDEGYKGWFWSPAFKKRGILVVGPLLGQEANAPFELYKQNNGEIY